MRSGFKKTVGKILQPINSYTRFPEYCFLGTAIARFVAEKGSRRSLRILDVGSPKLFGLYLAYRHEVEVYLTDISRRNIDEYIVLWDSIKDRAKGKTVFEQQDGRALSYPESGFDVVYAMSVVEHVEGDRQDSKTACEMLRVLKPGGLLALSVPFGRTHIEQSILGAAHTIEAERDQTPCFFQRIYDRSTVQIYLLDPLSPGVRDIQLWTVFRRESWLTRSYHWLRLKMGNDLNGLFGFMNPAISLILNCHRDGFYLEVPARYTAIHSLRDIYGDLILIGYKRDEADLRSGQDEERQGTQLA